MDGRNRRWRRWAVLLALGCAAHFANGAASQAAKIRVGPVEVSTGDEEERKRTDEDVAADFEEKEKGGTTDAPYAATSASPRQFRFAGGADAVVYHAHLSEVVDLGVAPYLARVVSEAEEAGAAAVIIEIDTPGGRVDAAIQIKDLLLNAEVPTIAFINKQAISAGALIALAHDYIVWTEGGTMGAATPIQLGGEGEAEPVEEKMVSYMRGVMRATAEAKGRDGLVAEAMVDASIDLPGFAAKDKLLTATRSQAEPLGLFDAAAESFDQVLEAAGLAGATVVEPPISIAETASRWLTHPIVSSVLMSLGTLGIIIEFYTPGFGLAGIAGIVCLALFFGGHLFARLAGFEELLLFVLGAAALVAELFVTPGFGLMGVAGALLVAASFVLALVGLGPGDAWSTGIIFAALLQVGIAIAVAGLCTLVALRFLPSVGPVRRLVLTAALRDEEGYVATDKAALAALVGRQGTALTDLRPVGRGLIDDRRFDVAAYGQYVKKGERFRVLSVDGPRITVERVDSTGGTDVV